MISLVPIGERFSLACQKSTMDRDALGARGRPFSRTMSCFLVFAALGLLFSINAEAGPNAHKLMKISDDRHRLASERTEATMLLQKKGEPARERQLVTVAVQDDRKGDRTRIRFSAPARIKGTALLTTENKKGGSDEQWLYLPAFRRTRRVGTAELGDRFVGTDFFYEDMKRREVDDYKHNLLRSEKVGGHDCWVIESRPGKPSVAKESPYGKQIIWLRKDIYWAVRARLFDKRMRPWKQLESTSLRKVKGKVWRADKVSMFDVRRNHRTVLKVIRRRVDIPIGTSTFTKLELPEPI